MTAGMKRAEDRTERAAGAAVPASERRVVRLDRGETLSGVPLGELRG